MRYFETSLMPQAIFLGENINYALDRYQLAGRLSAKKVILDAGCGTGFGADILIKGGAKKVYAIDNNQEVISYGRTHYQNQRLIFQKEDLCQLQFPDNYFDLICAFEVIEHVQNYQKVVGEFYRTLKPGGRLLISTPNKAVYSPFSSKPFYPFHYHEFNLAEFKRMLSNFKIKKILGQHSRNDIKLNSFSRRLYSCLPRLIKKIILKFYLKLSFFSIRPGGQKGLKSSVKMGNGLIKARIFVVICQKPERTNEEKIYL